PRRVPVPYLSTSTTQRPSYPRADPRTSTPMATSSSTLEPDMIQPRSSARFAGATLPRGGFGRGPRSLRVREPDKIPPRSSTGFAGATTPRGGFRKGPRSLGVREPDMNRPRSSAGLAGATLPGGRLRKGGKAPLRAEQHAHPRPERTH